MVFPLRCFADYTIQSSSISWLSKIANVTWDWWFCCSIEALSKMIQVIFLTLTKAQWWFGYCHQTAFSSVLCGSAHSNIGTIFPKRDFSLSCKCWHKFPIEATATFHQYSNLGFHRQMDINWTSFWDVYQQRRATYINWGACCSNRQM